MTVLSSHCYATLKSIDVRTVGSSLLQLFILNVDGLMNKLPSSDMIMTQISHEHTNMVDNIAVNLVVTLTIY
jgi:hypothetical protein